MGRAIFTVFFKIMQGIANIFLLPINALITNFVPDLATIITKFNLSVNYYLGGGITWFVNLLPPTTRIALAVYIAFLISYYTVTYAAHVILKVVTLIKNIKIW